MSFKSENMSTNTPTTVLSVEEEAKEWVNSHQPFLDLLKNDLPLKAGIMAYRDGYNSRDEEVAELVKALNYCSDILDGLINRTPTGDERNQLCDNNIHIKTLLLKY